MSRQAAEYGLVFEEPPTPLRVVGGRKAASSPAAKRDKPAPYIAPDSHRAHGTYVKYVVEKCRCEPCRRANRVYENRRNHAISRPDEAWVPYVPAGPARRHVRELAAQGVGIKTIAKLSGVPHGSLSRLMYGAPDRGGGQPSRRIRPETERRILAVTLEQASGAQKVAAGATWRLLDDLLARGFTKVWIAQQLVGPSARSLQVRRDLVRASTARKVEDLHTRLRGQAPPARNSRWGPR